jgi:hypothetical protein
MDEKDKKVTEMFIRIMFAVIIVDMVLAMLGVLPWWTMALCWGIVVAWLVFYLIKYLVLKKGKNQIVATKVKTKIDGNDIKQVEETTIKTPDGRIISQETTGEDNKQE